MNPFENPIMLNHREHLRGELGVLDDVGAICSVVIPEEKTYMQTKVAVYDAAKALGFKVRIKKSDNLIWIKRIS